MRGRGLPRAARGVGAVSRASVHLTAWALCAIALWLVGHIIDALWLRVAVKAVPALALAAAVWLGGSGGARVPVAVGLALSAVADVLLELPGLFVPGLATFLLAHVGYAVGFTAETRRLAPLLAAPFVGFVAVLVVVLWPHLGAMRPPVLAYAAAIAVMMWRAAARADALGGRAWLALIGAIVFATSDAMIALNRFHAPIEAVRVPIMATYWAAQALIAASVLPRATPAR